MNPGGKEDALKWTWLTCVQVTVVLSAGSVISVLLRDFNNALLLYLPAAIGIILVHWLGPKVLPFTFLNGILTLLLWNAPGGWARILLLATHEPVVAYLSWLLGRKSVDPTQGFHTTTVFAKFILFGIAIPELANCAYTYQYTFVGGDPYKVLLLWLSDFVTIFSIAVPVLHFIQPRFSTRGWVSLHLMQRELFVSGKEKIKTLAFLSVLFIGLNFIIDFYSYWFVYGICSAMVGLRRGFNTSLIINLILFTLCYLIPMVILFNHFKPSESQNLSVHLGMTAMFFVSALIGLVVSDFWAKEHELTFQQRRLESANDQLNKINNELDRFVYSVSHDISAPLKSIKGLVTLSRMDETPASRNMYLDKIETSVFKLENFISEVLDHSRTVRKEIQRERIHLESFFTEIADNLQYLENFNEINLSFDFQVPEIHTDKFLFKVAVSNLLSNSVKYQKQHNDHQREIKVSSLAGEQAIQICIADNGEGIADEYKDRIFDMFYRGTSNSSGSGLGLYIAREAVEKLEGSISVQTKYGEGSAFTVSIPHLT